MISRPHGHVALRGIGVGPRPLQVRQPFTHAGSSGVVLAPQQTKSIVALHELVG